MRNSHRAAEWADSGISPDDPQWAQAAQIGGMRYLSTSEDRWVTVDGVDRVTGEPKKIGVWIQKWYVAVRSHHGVVVIFRKYRHNKRMLYGDSRNDAPLTQDVGMDGSIIPGRDRGVKAIRRKPNDRDYVVKECARMYFAGSKEVADLFLQSVGL